MLSMRSRFAFSFILTAAGLLWLPTGSPAQDVPAQQQAATTPPAQLPAALAEVPEGQVVVTYHEGELMVKARNAALIDVLQTVCNQVGAVLDAPPEATDQILTVLGPGPVRGVLDALVSGSQFNYATAGSPDDPNALARVVVFAKTKDADKQAQAIQPEPQAEVTLSQVSSTPTDSVVEESGAKQMAELLAQAKAEIANSSADDDSAKELKAHADEFFELLEQQIKAAEAAEASNANSPQGKQPEGVAVPNPVPRHRRR